jgi:ketosteroid isomerase-like protein
MKKTVIALATILFCIGVLWGCSGSPSEGDEKIAKMAAKIERLENQLSDVQAIREIERLQAQYLQYVINNELDDVWTLFSEDGVLDVFQEKEPAKGHEAITAIFQERKAMIEKNLDQGGHAVMFDSSPVITVEGDTAKSHFLLFNMMEANEQMLGVQQGIYDLEFVKEGGGWKISFLKYTREFSIGASPAMGGPPGGAAPDGGPAVNEPVRE